MPSLTGGTQTIASKGAGTPVVTNDYTGIAVGVKGKRFRIQYKLGGDQVYDFGDFNAYQNKVITKASEVTVVNLGDTPVSYDVFV